MATTVSAYFQQGGRAHLAQPARCLEEHYSYSYSELPCGSVESRRRRLFGRCSEAFSARDGPREGPVRASAREPAARELPEVSVKRRSEELVRAARGSVRVGKLNVETGWGKVEEVRKKLENAASVSFSRSFESPPRRRLADSLFASFKLPRRKEPITKSNSATPTGSAHETPTMTSQRCPVQPREHKRKSAVELLAETKAFYVKSETVLDRKQELPLRVSSGLGQAIVAGGCVPVSSTAVNSAVCCQPYGSTPPGRPLCAPGGARRAVSAGDGLQSTLRRLLDHSDSRENVYWQPVYAVPHKVRGVPLHMGTLPGPKRMNERQLMENITADIAYSIPSSLSSPERICLPAPVSPPEGGIEQEIGAISPPAQYAHSTRERYVRSNSQSSATVRRDSCDETDYNINSHKSLPDLHTHARCYNDNVSTSGAETMGRSPRRRRHSTHQRTASCSSKGTRSNHSSLVSSCEAFSEHPSPGEDNYSYNRCGSSFARDSGGSSGHYTQRSAPPHRHAAPRTDSNSSGQHSHNRSHYAVGYEDLPTWPVSAPLQFQDGAPSPPPPPPHHPPPPCLHHADTRVSIHFQASAPPPQFQDDPPPPIVTEPEPRQYSATLARCRPPRTGVARDYNRYDASPDESRTSAVYAEPRVVRAGLDNNAEYVNTQQMHSGGSEEVTSPLGTFKRQRCLRYKQRRPRPILRSKSDISDSRYRRCDGRSPSSAPCDDDSPDSSEESSAKLNRFFQHLGLDQRSFDDLLTSSPTQTDSPIFFSDVSTVDSNQVALATDYTVQGPQTKPIYRNAEPPSVVERNARIIKWLCNCRKMQHA